MKKTSNIRSGFSRGKATLGEAQTQNKISSERWSAKKQTNVIVESGICTNAASKGPKKIADFLGASRAFRPKSYTVRNSKPLDIYQEYGVCFGFIKRIVTPLNWRLTRSFIGRGVHRGYTRGEQRANKPRRHECSQQIRTAE